MDSADIDGPDRRTRAGRRRADRSEPLRVLIIDSHADTALLHSLVLEQAGYSVMTERDGQEGWEAATQSLPDIILTELRMPTLDAFGLMDLLWQEPTTRDIPVVVLTAAADSRTFVHAREAGAVQVLVKTGEMTEVVEAVRQVAAQIDPRKLLRRQLRRTLLALRRVARAARVEDDVRAWLRAAIDRLQVAVLVFDEAGQAVAANGMASELTGYTREELQSMSLDVLTDDAVRQVVHEELATGHFEGQYMLRQKDGTTVGVSAVGLAHLSTGLHSAAFMRDA